MSTAPKTALRPTGGEAADPVPEAPTHEEIATLAYHYWETRGRPIGSPEEDWFRAEQDVLMERLIWGRESGRSGPSPSRRLHTS